MADFFPSLKWTSKNISLLRVFHPAVFFSLWVWPDRLTNYRALTYRERSHCYVVVRKVNSPTEHIKDFRAQKVWIDASELQWIVLLFRHSCEMSGQVAHTRTVG